MSQDWKFSFFQKKHILLVKQADLRDMFGTASDNVCTTTVAVTADRLFPTQSTSSAMKTPADTEPDDPESVDEEISKWNTAVISCAAKL